MTTTQTTMRLHPLSRKRSNISRFGNLHGMEISKLETGRGLLLTPYSTLSPRKQGSDDFEVAPKAGLDLRYPLTSLTVDVTINPDFAQIEADPAEVNLSDIERRFAEKRPFFLEGSEYFTWDPAPNPATDQKLLPPGP